MESSVPVSLLVHMCRKCVYLVSTLPMWCSGPAQARGTASDFMTAECNDGHEHTRKSQSASLSAKYTCGPVIVTPLVKSLISLSSALLTTVRFDIRVNATPLSVVNANMFDTVNAVPFDSDVKAPLRNSESTPARYQRSWVGNESDWTSRHLQAVKCGQLGKRVDGQVEDRHRSSLRQC